MSRTNKREYTGAKVFVKSCGNHGGCKYCLSNRMKQDRVNRSAADAELHRWKKFGVDPEMGQDVSLVKAGNITEPKDAFDFPSFDEEGQWYDNDFFDDDLNWE